MRFIGRHKGAKEIAKQNGGEVRSLAEVNKEVGSLLVDFRLNNEGSQAKDHAYLQSQN